MQSDKATPPKVSAMISVFDTKREPPGTTKPLATTPTVGVSVPRRQSKHTDKTEKDPNPLPMEETKPSPVATMSGPFKLIHVSGSGKVVDEKAPTLSRTLNHFKSGGNIGQTSKGNRGAMLKEPAIKPMGYQGPAYYGSPVKKKMSSPVPINCSLPRKERKTREQLKEEEEREGEVVEDMLSKSTPHFSSSSGHAPSSDCLSASPHTHTSHSLSPPPTETAPNKHSSIKRQASFPREATPTGSSSPRAIKQPGGTWFTSSHESQATTGSSYAPVKVKTWDKMGNNQSRLVKRSQSFTSRVSVDVKGERHRSSSPPSSSSPPASSSSSPFSSPQKVPFGGTAKLRSVSTLGKSQSEEETPPPQSGITPIVVGKRGETSSIVLSAPISVDVSRTAGSNHHVSKGTKTLTSNSSSLNVPPALPKPSKSSDSYKYNSLPSKKSTSSSSILITSSTHTGKVSPKTERTASAKRDTRKDVSSSPPLAVSSKKTGNASTRKMRDVSPRSKRKDDRPRSERKDERPRSDRKDGSPVSSRKRIGFALSRKDESPVINSRYSKLHASKSSETRSSNQKSRHDKRYDSSRPDMGGLIKDPSSLLAAKAQLSSSSFEGHYKKRSGQTEEAVEAPKSKTLPNRTATSFIRPQELCSPSSPLLARLALDRRGSPATPPMSIKSRIAIFQEREEETASLSSSLPRNMYGANRGGGARPKSSVNEYRYNQKLPSGSDRGAGINNSPTKRLSLPAPPTAPKPKKSSVSRVGSSQAPPTLEEEQDEDYETMEAGRGGARMRIHSESKESNKEDDKIKIQIFEDGIPDEATATLNTKPETDDVYDDIMNVDEKERVSKETLQKRSTRYSYQEYTMMRKMNKSSSSTSSLPSEANKALAAIPENTMSTSLRRKEKEQEGGDEESDLMKRMSRISGTFYEEMIDSIALKLANNGGEGEREEAPLDRVEKVRQQLFEVVEDAVSNDPLLEAEGFYETLEEYSRKVSDYYLHCANAAKSEEVPPELPPRPEFLLKLIKEEEREGISSSTILEEYEEMTSAAAVSQPPLPLYEPVSYNNNDIHDGYSSSEALASPRGGKGKKKTSKIPFMAKKNLEGSSSKPTSPTFLKENSSSLPRPVPNKKKKKIISFPSRRSVKVEPTSAPVRSVSVSHSASSSPRHGLYEEMHTPTSPQPPHSYVNVSRSVSLSQSRSPYEIIGVSHDDDDPIPPTYSSESEGEEMGGICDRNSSAHSSIKRPWKDLEAPSTPDSSVFTDEHETTDSLHLNDHTASPLVTKMSINMNTPTHQLLRTSVSDSAIHSSLVAAHPGRPHPPVSPIPSFSELSNDSNVESTPSICSFDSNRFSGGIGGVELKVSPPSSLMRKRVKSDASEDRYHGNARKGAEQKALLWMMNQKRKRRGSVPGNSPEVSSTDGVIEVPTVYADALMDCTGLEPSHLSFKVNDVIAILDMTDDDWWQGIVEDRIGWFSSSWVRLRINQEDGETSSLQDRGEQPVSTSPGQEPTGPSPEGLREERGGDKPAEGETGGKGNEEEANEQDTLPDLEQMPKHNKPIRRRTIRKRDSGDLPRSLLPSQIRAKCIEEILNTERVYVDHLKNIVEGFLYPCRQREQLFTQERVETIFSNIEDIYRFQQYFLEQLESRIDFENVQDSRIGEIFVKMKDSFSMYSEYCNNHPHAVNEMNLLQQDQQYLLFFEACRLLKGMADISLEGFLLNPVQRICRYPLQLSELVKYTPESHPDYSHVVAAQKAMTGVAVLINERKRRMEALGRLRTWQNTLDNWRGPDIMERSTELIHGGELHKISKGRCQERHFFLFDHQLVYCKKDAIGARLSYKGRIDTDKCQMIDLKDGELTHGGSGVKNAWKINNCDKDDKWYVLFAKTTKIKEDWMKAFKRERQQVEDDKINGFIITPKMKRAAIALFNTTSEPITRKQQQRKNHDMSDSLPIGMMSTLPSRGGGGSEVTSSLTFSPVERKKRHKNKKV